MHTLIIDFFSFTLKKGLYLINSKSEIIETLYLPPNEIVDYIGHDVLINEVRLMGPSNICEEISKELKEELDNNYPNREIKVEIAR